MAVVFSSPLGCSQKLRRAPVPLVHHARINQHVPETEERRLATHGAISRYHMLLNLPFSLGLSQSGYIVGIEKAPRARIGFSDAGGFDSARLRVPFVLPHAGHRRDLEQQQAAFRRTLADPKVMFVSHILRYGPDTAGQAITPELLYATYSRTAFGPTPDPGQPEAYARGWDALDALEARIVADAAAARDSGTPFTHLLVLSMGWNNDQIEAVERYNSVVQHTRLAAHREGRVFRPLVIGLTWPSVWGGTSPFDLANRALHIGSYTVKAGDSDEIGYGIANHIVNAMLPRIETAAGLSSVLIGHSMGARILTRAYYSADLLRNPSARTQRAPLMIGLQAAFSANRFRAGYQLIPPVRWAFSGEGGPYQDHDAPGGSIILTWATGDRANPVARLATGAQHVGGPPGARVMTGDALRDKVLAHEWRSADAARTACAQVQVSGRVLYVDASGIIAAHGDIRSPHVGQLVWTMIDGLRPCDGS